MSLFLVNGHKSILKPYLLPAVYPVPPQDWCAPCCHPHPRQRVAVHLVLLDDPLSFLVLWHIQDVLQHVTNTLWFKEVIT